MLFHPPYRWVRCPFQNISYMWYELTNGVRNLVRWFPVIWRDKDFDWDHLAEMMETKLRWMAEDTKSWHVVRAERDGRDMRICVVLLSRLREGCNGYWERSVAVYGENKYAAEHAQEVQKNDLKLLGKILGRRMNVWWD